MIGYLQEQIRLGTTACERKRLEEQLLGVAWHC